MARQRGALHPRGPVRRLHEGGLQPSIPLAGLAGALAAAALVIAGGHPGPGREVRRRWEPAHVDADLGHQQFGHRAPDAGDRVQQRDDRFLLVDRAQAADLRIEAGDRRVQPVDLDEQLGQRLRQIWDEGCSRGVRRTAGNWLDRWSGSGQFGHDGCPALPE